MTLKDAKELITKRLDIVEKTTKEFGDNKFIVDAMSWEMGAVQLRWVLNLLENVNGH